MEKNIDKFIGRKIAKIRKERSLTQAHLAELINVATETISRLERGVSIPSLKTLEKISQILQTPLKEFFDFDYSPKPKKVSSKKELAKLNLLFQTKSRKDIKMGYQVLKAIFEKMEKYGSSKKKKRS